MAEVQSEIVSGVGANAKRRDLGNVAKIQRSAKLQNATGGAYGERAELREIAGAASPTPTASSFDAGSARMVESRPSIPPVGIFEDTRYPNEPITSGAPGFESRNDVNPFAAPDEISVLARAMYLANPTPQLRRIVEAFNQEGR